LACTGSYREGDFSRFTFYVFRFTEYPIPMKQPPTLPCSPLQRVNYFTGHLVTAKDFEAEQNYFLEKHRRHNLLCHGPGVVQGLQVSVDPKPGSGGGAEGDMAMSE